jgi:hypothetical protein
MPDDPDERRRIEADITDIETKMAASEGWEWVCRLCAKTPADIGWCDQCGYNRPYDKTRTVTVQ